MNDVVKRPPGQNGRYPGTGQRPPAKRRRKRKRNMSLYYIMVFIIVAFAVYILTFYVFFRIDNITVKGTSLYDPEQVIAVSGMKKGDNLFRTDTSQVEQNLSGFMVYADEIKVRRKLPSSIVITVTEAEPLYNLEQNGRYFLVSKSGKILEGDMTAPRSGLLIVKGFEIKDETPNSPLESKDNLKGKILEDISEGLENAGLSDVLSVDMTDRTDIKLNYDNRIEIRLGSSYDISYKLNYTKAVIQSLEDTYDGSYKGTLIYHSATSGMSAIADETVNQPEENPDSGDDTDGADGNQNQEQTADENNQNDENIGDNSTGDEPDEEGASDNEAASDDTTSTGDNSSSGDDTSTPSFPLDEGISVDY